MPLTETDLDATARFDLEGAPGGMRLLQDLVNTRPPEGAPHPDLLRDAETASAWLAVAMRTWSERSGQDAPDATVTERELPALRAFREQLGAWLADRERPLATPERAIAVGLADGRATHRPRRGGADGLVALVALELLMAQHAEAPPRLKACANPDCGAAFYDRSRNLSRVWHDVRTCGNQANLRASRARRRDTTPS